MAIDAYNIFLKNFNIDEDEFIKYGIQQVQMVQQPIAKTDWEKLKNSILNGSEEVHIRSYGVKGQNSYLYLEAYSDYFKKSKILIDKTNNQKAQKKIYNLLDFNQKYNKPDDKTLFNYQASHIFSKTKNPFCFLAPWNIVLLPKIYDPLTGHEAKGSLVDKFTKALQLEVYKKFEMQIEDFNKLMDEHSEEILSRFEIKNKAIEKYSDHHLNLKEELTKIPKPL